jgi:uncharacterized membrane protein
MAIKIFKVIWFFSLLGLVADFMYIYATWPETVVVFDKGEPLTLSRESLFYIVLVFIALINMLVFVITRVFPEDKTDFKSWFYGMVICLNLFFVVAISFVGVYNSGEKFRYEEIGAAVYGSVILLLGWAIAWPVYVIYSRLTNKTV